MNKSITKSNYAIIDKVIPTSKELFEYRFSNNVYHSEWYKNLTEKLDNLLRQGNRNFTITTTPLSLLAAEYIAQQKNSQIRFHRIKLHILIPERNFLSFFNINLSEYPNLLKGFTNVTILSPQSNRHALKNAVNLLHNMSDNIFEI